MRKARVARWLFVGALTIDLYAVSLGTALGGPGPEENVARARELFTAATEQRDGGDAKGALPKFEAAYALARNPVTALELGRTYVLTGMLVEARAMFDSIANMPQQPDETPRAVEARHDAARLAGDIRSRVPSLTVKIGEGAPDVMVTVDGAVVPVAVLAGPLALNPGKHSVVATIDTGARAETTVPVVEGDVREVELKPAPLQNGGPTRRSAAAHANHEATSTTALPSTQVAERSGPATLLAYAGFGVGALGFIVGGVAGAAAIQKVSGVEASCRSMACVPAVSDELESARSLGYVATAALIAAGAGVTVGIAGLLLRGSSADASTGTRASVRAWAGLGVGGIQGSF